ncbi:Non-specific phospholipase C3 [Camellia lanceoleosa]|uniref:Non-specific phospholipase C3 n=1 Tax=Camellia lanceoleosa TaxID=1840588 RepID=A0ACC0IBY4_9ERIC|nr:Non-specific phospholipase C3 [Camellia lanceoleosa]
MAKNGAGGTDNGDGGDAGCDSDYEPSEVKSESFLSSIGSAKQNSFHDENHANLFEVEPASRMLLIDNGTPMPQVGGALRLPLKFLNKSCKEFQFKIYTVALSGYGEAEREAEAKENAKLTEFQEKMVQKAATLCGDRKEDIYPDKLVKKMTVGEAVNYVNNSFKKFLDKCEKAKASGADEFEICVPSDDDPPKPSKDKSKSFASKFFSYVACAKS